MFLTTDELYRITRKRQRAAQIRVLVEKGYAFEHDAAGWPLVLRSSVEAKIAQKAPARRREPDSAALAALMGSR